MSRAGDQPMGTRRRWRVPLGFTLSVQLREDRETAYESLDQEVLPFGWDCVANTTYRVCSA